jgi:multimeric flavodoxin WrbA
MQKKPKLLGVAASLRNARWGAGNAELIGSLKKITKEEDLFLYLAQESELHLENFLNAGRKDQKSFLEIYSNLKKNKGDKGLSNSEVALASALWAALFYDVDIDHISLAEYFLASGSIRNESELKNKLIEADGLLISGPVYFGDRGSLVQSLINLIKSDKYLKEKLTNKIYAGISVGAKRNGGQETTLIYQMFDFINLGYWAVGNDSDTTAQYGGTCLAGDIGTMHKDAYGLKTSMGTGRRIASVIRETFNERPLKGPVKVVFLILQDKNLLAKKKLEKMIDQLDKESCLPTILDVSNKSIMPCIACDICPTHIDVDSVYRCIINSKNDDLAHLHGELLNYDAICPVIYSPCDSENVKSNYQTFIERTRYLRRGDYVFNNQLVAPLIFEEVGANENYALRAITSMIRHHTVISNPIIAFLHNNIMLNEEKVRLKFNSFIDSVRKMASARIGEIFEEKNHQYNPVGYLLSANKDLEDNQLNLRKKMVNSRIVFLKKEAKDRLGEI